MKQMSQIEPNRDWLLRYVFGELSEDETRQADERFFADDGFAGMLDETYRDTLDAYAAGEIRGSDQERVERAFFEGAHQVGRLRILQAMQSIPERTPEVALPAARPGVHGTLWFVSFWPVAASVGALGVALALVVYQHNEKPRAPESRNAATSEAVRSAPAPAVETPAVPTPAGTLYTILLLPDVSRGNEDAKKFAIPSPTHEIVFQAVLPQNAVGAQFRIRLKGAKQTEAKVFSGLQLRVIDNQKYLEFRVPQGELPGDDYAVEVFAEGATTRAVEHFVVRIIRVPAL